MSELKQIINNRKEFLIFSTIYLILFMQAIFFKNSPATLISAICGITYTIFAGKGFPFCYIIGLCGTSFYVFLSIKSNLWGNALLNIFYYIPMQISGFFLWYKNLKPKSFSIKKSSLLSNEKKFLAILTFFATCLCILVLSYTGDKYPFFDGITTIGSILGMYLTVKRCIEQWFVWFYVNLFSCLMWINIYVSGEKVSSLVFMWMFYIFLAIYFYKEWKQELGKSEN